jgi:hypothetical protein
LGDIEMETTFAWRKALCLKDLGQGGRGEFAVSVYVTMVYDNFIFPWFFLLTMPIHTV